MLHLSTECCVKRAYPQCVDVIAIHKIASTRMFVLKQMCVQGVTIWIILILMQYFEDPWL
jgi:hypothetical protein